MLILNFVFLDLGKRALIEKIHGSALLNRMSRNLDSTEREIEESSLLFCRGTFSESKGISVEAARLTTKN
jgi:hypothetical protein